MKRLISDRRWVGIPVAVLFMAAFVLISLYVNRSLALHGAHWFVFSSALRIIFGINILRVVKTLYGRSTEEILTRKNSRAALVAGAGFIGYFLYFLIDMAAGFKAFTAIPLALFFAKVILQQAATGFYEEAHYRLLICEGYFHGTPGAARRIVYALVSAALFGALHVVTGWDSYRFALTGAIGFAFAAMYLLSRNIVVPMVLHALYDVAANLEGFIEWNQSALFESVNALLLPVALVMAAVSAVMLLKAPLSPADDRPKDAFGPNG